MSQPAPPHLEVVLQRLGAARGVLRRREAGKQGLMDTARHVIGCRLTLETRVQKACDDVASTIHLSLPDSEHGRCARHMSVVVSSRRVPAAVTLKSQKVGHV